MHEQKKLVRPLKVLSRLPYHKSAGLAHLCANPVYKQLLTTPLNDWQLIENDELNLLSSFCNKRALSDEGEVIVSDATMIAINQFAAKTGQWNLANSQGTFYPFFMPNMVDLGRTIPTHFMFNQGMAKPILKKLVAKTQLGSDYAFRKKSGLTAEC